MTSPHGLQADFHTHSTASDGALAPAELAQIAASRGLSVFALTDHDTLAGLADAESAAEKEGLLFVRGVELSTMVPRGEVHVLGYGIDPSSPPLLAELERFRQSRRTRAAKMLDRLRDIGIELDARRLGDITDESSIGRPHIARLLIEAGHASSVQDAFDRFLARDRPGYVAREALEPAAAVRLIRDAGGVPVFAHPLSDPDHEARIGELVQAGLRGIEVYYGEYDDDQRRGLAELARSHNLLPSGGSDYHGPDFRAGRELGSVSMPRSVIMDLLDAVGLEFPNESIC